MNKLKELKGLMTKNELLKKVEQYEVAEPVDVQLGSNIHFSASGDGNVSITHPKGETSLTPNALGLMIANVGLPRPYMKKIPKDQIQALVIPHLVYWYCEALAGNTLRLFNIGNNAITVAPRADFEHVRISDIINAIEQQLGKDIGGYHKLSTRDSSFRFSVVATQEVEIAGKDLFNAGIRVEHSLTAQESTRVSAYVFRQWCSNGATTEDELDSWRRRGNEDFRTWIQKSVIEARRAFGKEVDRIKNLLSVRVDDNTSTILNSVLERSSVPLGLQKEVQAMVIDRQPETLYDIYNILTQVDTHSNYFVDHPTSQGLLDRVARHLTRHSKLCSKCHQQIN